MIDGLYALAAPNTPPTHFERQERRVPCDFCDSWDSTPDKPPCYVLTRGFSDSFSSSSQQGTLENLSKIWLEERSTTASDHSVSNALSDMLLAEKRSVSVVAKDASENLFELRRLTGFTWERLAELLNVDRRTLYNWVKGGEIRERNRDRIAKTLGVLRYADRGSADDNAQVLDLASSQGLTPFDAIKEERYSVARQAMSHGVSRPALPPLAQSTEPTLRWGAHTMAIHEDAFGNSDLQVLPDEPKPASRKRRIKRD